VTHYQITAGESIQGNGAIRSPVRGNSHTVRSSGTSLQSAVRFRVAVYRGVAYLLAFAAGAAAMSAFRETEPVRATHSPTAGDTAPQNSPQVIEHPIDERALDVQSEATPAEMESRSAVEAAISPAQPATSLCFAGITEPAPGRFAKLPLATSQAVAFVDVSQATASKKGGRFSRTGSLPTGCKRSSPTWNGPKSSRKSRRLGPLLPGKAWNV
jgi:hypothetical protein